MILRPYQFDACEAVRDSWNRVNSALVEMPTGTGKTIMFAELAATFEWGRVLVVCPAIALVAQAAKKLYQRTGTMPDIEQAENESNESDWGRNKFVVASKQTLLSKRGEGIRGDRIRDVGLVVFDEAHMGVDGIKKLIRTYPDAKYLGVTATPKRHDKIGLHNVFEECAYQYAILDAIKDGWLVEPRAKCVQVQSLDLSQIDIVQTANGKDYSPKQLAEALEQEKTVIETAEIAAREWHGEKTVVYCESIEQARKVANRIQDTHNVKADWICSDQKRQSKRDRQRALEGFTQGNIGIICNCGILTTGWDFPPLMHIVMARPTRSLALYTQILGRGTRPLEGVVDFEGSTAESRLDSIAASEKPFFRVTDLVDSTLEHKIVTAMDALAGKVLPEVVAKAKADAKADGELKNVREALDEAAQQIRDEEELLRVNAWRKRLASVAVRLTAHERQVNVFDQRNQVVGVKREKAPVMLYGKHKGKPIDQIPTGYLKWVVESAKKESWFTKAVNRELTTRKGAR